MRSDNIGKHLVIAFLLAFGLYAGGFALDQHLRTRHGPWEVTFTRAESGDPALVVSQSSLGLSNVTLVFPGATASYKVGTVSFDQPGRALPFGQIKFTDLTSLPGTVTLEFDGQEVELLPRTLYLNRQPHAWESGVTLSLTPEVQTASQPETQESLTPPPATPKRVPT